MHASITSIHDKSIAPLPIRIIGTTLRTALIGGSVMVNTNSESTRPIPVGRHPRTKTTTKSRMNRAHIVSINREMTNIATSAIAETGFTSLGYRA